MARGKVVAGIDIGTDKICTIIASPSEESGKTNVIGVAAMPSVGLRKSQIVDLEDAINAITDSVEAAERMAGYNINSAYVSISGAHIESQNSKGVVAVSEPEGEITTDDVDRVIEAARAVSLPSAREILHVIPRDFIVDSQSGIKDPVGMTGVRLEAEAHLITGSQTALRNITKCVSELGIAVNGVVFSGLASSLAVLSETEKELGVIVIDIGGGTTSITAFVEGSLAYSAVIPIGAKNITNDIAIGMRVSLQSAEKIKLYLSQHNDEFNPPPGAKASDVAKLRRDHDTLDLQALDIKEDSVMTSKKGLADGIIRPRLNEIFSLANEAIKSAQIAGKTPAGIVITGGGADTVGILEACKRTLSLPARIGIPKGLSGLVDELSAPSYATATGLIQYALKNSEKPSSRPTKDMLAGLSRFSGKGIVHKVSDLIKSLLP